MNPMTHNEIERRFGYYSGPLQGYSDGEIRSMYFSGLINRATAIRYHYVTRFIHSHS
jgi:hypothetical protein